VVGPSLGHLCDRLTPDKATQAEQKSIEQKNHELVEAFREKSKNQQQIQKLYQSLKAQVMASHVATAATDEAEHTIYTSRGDRFVDRIPGTRSGLQQQFQQFTLDQQGGGRQHRHQKSVSSGSRGGQGRETINILGPAWASQAQDSRSWTARTFLWCLLWTSSTY
jgi:E3 ubiquitin-protein ligase CCNP1IP1